ncbi:MAG TPA: hypothetical protein VNN80_21605 [Polyangiaceae bacterium]|jgi:hypothetical protein|nr:hypothetical protein [Polyangiaceae bacterium]
MTRAAQYEIRRLARLQQGTELSLMLLTERGRLSTAEESQLRALEQRQRQLADRIAWFEAILREHDVAAE